MIPLPPFKYLKDRAISDDTYSDYAQGWDDCLHAELLDAHGIPYRTRRATAQECKDME